MINKIFGKLVWLLGTLRSKALMKRERVIHGSRLRLNGTPFIVNKGKFVFGKDVTVNSGIRFNPIGGQDYSSFWIKDNGELIIGDQVKISNTSFVAEKSIRVEDGVYIGGSCRIYDTDFHSLEYEKRIASQDNTTQIKSVIIRKRAFIGAHVTILKGVEIGADAIIGAGSVVSKSVPTAEVWFGNPARFIKKL